MPLNVYQYMSDQGAIIDLWDRLMTDVGWTHTIDQAKSTISCFSTNEIASFRIQIYCDPNNDHVVAMIPFEKRCPTAYRQSMFEIVNWLNSQRVESGFFSLDPREGEVRYRYPEFVRGLRITPEFVDSFLKRTISYAKTNYDVIQKGLLGYSLSGAQPIKGRSTYLMEMS
jgi:hypothetical protein